jgi:RHS repeat-associated protein
MSRKRIVGGRASVLGCALLVAAACGTEAIEETSEGTPDAGASIPNAPDAARGGTGAVPEAHDDGGGGSGASGGLAGTDRPDAGSLSDPEPLDDGPGGASNEPDADETEPEVLALEPCDPNAPFDAPVPAFTGTMNADGLTFSADGLTAYISGVGTGGYDLFKATRTATTPFGTPTLVPTINTSQNERAPTLSADGLTLYFTAPNNSADIAKAVRATVNDPFGSVQVFAPPLNSSNGGVSDQDPFWWGSQTLLFASERPSGAHRELYYTTLTGSTFSEPQKIASADINSPYAINSPYEDFRPVLTGDGLTLFFASKRPGIGNDTGGDVWVAKRSSTTPFTQPFAAAANLWTVNSSGNEFPVYVTPDGCSLYFASNEETGFGSTENYRLYQATRPTAAPAQVTVTLNVVGQGKVVYGTLNCGAGTPGACTASGAPNTPFAVTATGGQATWIGSCTANGGQPSSDGIIVLAQNGVCTVTFATAPPSGVGGACTTSINCQQGLQCTSGTCQCMPGAACSAQCPCGSGGSCTATNQCQQGLMCTNGTCGMNHCSNSIKDGNETDADCGGSCAPCPGGKVCNTQTDCAGGLICETNNGACFGLARDERVCWPAECTDGIDDTECGQPTSPCGSLCGCGVSCNTEEPASTCPTGEECLRDFGRVLSIPSRDACGPGGGICPSDESDLCGDELKLCGKNCICIPDCSSATPENPSDGCGGLCRAVCPIGLRGCCTQDYECAGGGACLTDPDGVRTCRPTGSNGCDNRALKPPLCGTPSALCGPVCPTCTPNCAGRECGPDPECGESCGTPAEDEYCDEAGQIRSASVEPPVQVPDGNGGLRDLLDVPVPTANGIGAIAGQFSVSEQGTAQYTIPIDVPPGRAGMTPALSLVYQASRDNGSLGVGWRIDGLSKITRCPKTFALDGYAAAVKNDNTDAFCLDGKRLYLLTPQTGANPEYRTIVDSLAKIESYQDDGQGIQPEQPAGVPMLNRSLQGPDRFEVRTKDGRIMVYGGTRDSLLIGTAGSVPDERYGVRQTWLLRQIRDRAENTIDYSYDNLQRRFMNSRMPDARRPNIVHPRAITYTGHGNTLGNRRVVFDYETRPDPTLRFLQGGVAWSVQDRLKQITTYVDQTPVKNYRLNYAQGKDFSQVESIKECEGVADDTCKLPTSFQYESIAPEDGFEDVNAAIDGRGQLDADGNGIPDYFSTQVEVKGTDANPELVAAQIAVDVGIAIATSPFGPEVSVPVQVLWSAIGPAIWGMLAEKPKVTIDHFVALGTANRGDPLDIRDASGVPCSYANSFQDFNRDGKDDLLAYCSSGFGANQEISIALSNGDGTFHLIGGLQMPPGNDYSSNKPRHDSTPVFYDADGDSLVDVLSCSDVCTIEFRRRLSPSENAEASFASPIRFRPTCTEECILGNCDIVGDPEPFCVAAPERTHALFDIDGDGTPDLLNPWRISRANGTSEHGWRVLRYTTGSGGHLAWEEVAFPNVDLSELGDNMQLADFNSDGLQDVLHVKPTLRYSAPNGQDVNIENRHATIWLNTGNGVFMARSLERPIWDDEPLYGNDLSTVRVAPADYNGDGRMDWLEVWRDLVDDGSQCDGRFNAALLPNSAINSVSVVEAPNDLQRISLGCAEVPGTIEMIGDFDADGAMDLFGEGRAYYGKGKHTLLLKSVKDGLGNITSVAYDGPTTYKTNNNCTGTTWPEQCLKRMTGLVSEHTEGVVLDDGSVPWERRTTYTYENARMSTTGHGWIGFDRRTVVEGPATSGGIPTEPTPPGTEESWTTTTINTEPVARYTLSGVPTTSTAPPYIYPFAGLPRTIQVDRKKGKTALESTPHRRRTRIENAWKTMSSAGSTLPLAFPYVETRTTSVYEAELPAAAGDPDGGLLTRCTETMVLDQYGNVTEHQVDCPDQQTQTISEFTDLEPSTWLISNPSRVTTRSERGGSFEEQVWGFDYFSNGLLESVTRSPGLALSERHTTQYTRNAFGNIETSTEFVQTGEESRQTVFTYDIDDVYVRSITNQLGHKTEFLFDRRWGAPKAIVDPNGIAAQFAYDGLGLLGRKEDPGGTTTYAYASSTRSVATTIGPVFPRVSISISREGRDGSPSGSILDELDYRGRSVLTTTEGFDGVPLTSERRYDVHGRLAGATARHTADANVVPRKLFSYDGLDRLKRVTHLPDTDTFSEIQRASVVTLASQFQPWIRGYECFDQPNSIQPGCPVEIEQRIDEEGKSNVAVSDASGLVNRTIDGENLVSALRLTTYLYGPFQHMQEIEQRQFENTTLPSVISRIELVHDAFGRLQSYTEPDSGTGTYTYNGFDETKTSLDPKSQLRTIHYDRIGRATSVVDPGIGTTQWIYDQGVNALGRISKTISPPTTEAPDGQQLTYTYEPKTGNNRGLLKTLEYKIDSVSYPINFTYDAHGRPDTVAYPDRGNGPPVVGKYSYDDFGFMTDLEEVGSGTARPIWHMDEAFQAQLLERETFGDGTTTAYSYNPSRRFVETIDTTFTSDPIRSVAYTHYKNGLVRERIKSRGDDPPDTRVHYYDALNRLAETFDTSSSNPGTSVIYGYDHLGNLTQRGATALLYNAQKPRHLASVGNNTYLYDPNGNVRSRQGPNVPVGSQVFEYTPFDLPSTILTGQDQGTRTTRFEYSANQERLVRRDTGPGVNRTRHFATDFYQRVVDNVSGATTEERFRLFVGTREVAQITRENGVDKTLYFHADNLGTVDTITSDGDVFAQEFDPFGSELNPPASDVTRVGFTGHQHDDDLGLVDMKGRVYDPLAARFTTQDPIMQAPFWSQGLNRYAYVFNNPVNNVDPSGFQADGVSSFAGAYTFSPDGLMGHLSNPAGGVPGSGPGLTLNPTSATIGAIVTVGTKLATGQYLSTKPTPGKEFTVTGGNAAPTSNPTAGGLHAASNNRGVAPLVQPAGSLPAPGGASHIGSPYDYNPIYMLFGTAVHLAIESAYKAINRHVVFTESTISTIGKALGKPGGSIWDKVDIFDAKTGDLWDIKVAGSEAKGQADALHYVGQLTAIKVHARPGSVNAPGTWGTVVVWGFVVEYWSDVPGVISYNRGKFGTPDFDPNLVPTSVLPWLLKLLKVPIPVR